MNKYKLEVTQTGGRHLVQTVYMQNVDQVRKWAINYLAEHIENAEDILDIEIYKIVSTKGQFLRTVSKADEQGRYSSYINRIGKGTKWTQGGHI